MGIGGDDDVGVRKRGCSCTKDDFLPEESFQSWSNYGRALRETPKRFMDRVVARSLDSTELHEVKAASEHEMKKNLNWWDLMWFGIGAVIGAGIFVLTGLEARDHAGPAVVLSYVVSGVSAMLSVFCYTEFAVEIPVAGRRVIRILESGARRFPSLHSSRKHPLRVRSKRRRRILSTKGSSRFNYIASIFHVVIILFIIVAGFTKSDVKNFTPFAPYGARGIFVSAAVLFFAYVGFDAVSTMAEETKNPGRDIPIGLVIDPDAPFSVAFEAVGWKWAKYIVAAGALKGMTTVLLVSAVGQARYLTHIARTHMMPPWLAHVNAKTGTPVNATVVMGAGTAVIALFTKLDILSNLLCDHRWRSPEADRLHCWHLGISGWDGGLVGARKRVGWVCCDGGDLGCGDGGACLCGAAS
ncbi:Cationic amino acid transporter 1 [Linum grandiflorum]